MARIVLGLGTSHTPMLLASDETLERFIETDQKIKHRDKEGRPVTYGELLEKADPKMAHMVAPANLVARQNVARDAIKQRGTDLANANLDALIVFGDDQNESYKEDCRPAFAVYYGDTIRNENKQHEDYSQALSRVVRQEPPGLLRGGEAARLSGAFEARRPSDRIADGRGFRHARVEVPAGGRRRRPRHRLCASPRDGRAKPVPTVPIFLNTYFPPNQPRPKRCYEFGQAMRKAVEAFPGEERIGVLASGGLSHFCRRGPRPRDPEGLRRQGREIPADPAAQQAARGLVGNPQLGRVAGAVEHLDLDWFEYVPGYRTPAGTGTGMSFAGPGHKCFAKYWAWTRWT